MPTATRLCVGLLVLASLATSCGGSERSDPPQSILATTLTGDNQNQTPPPDDDDTFSDYGSGTGVDFRLNGASLTLGEFLEQTAECVRDQGFEIELDLATQKFSYDGPQADKARDALRACREAIDPAWRAPSAEVLAAARERSYAYVVDFAECLRSGDLYVGETPTLAAFLEGDQSWDPLGEAIDASAHDVPTGLIATCIEQVNAKYPG